MSTHGSTYFSNGCIYADIDNLVLRFDNVDVSKLQKNEEMLTGIHFQHDMFGCKPERQYYTNESMMKLVRILRSNGVTGEMDMHALRTAMMYNVKQPSSIWHTHQSI